ncbi:MAG: hypothetical protein QF363_17550 [Planctomycetaceae bacterium]|nr:hypothetical protein [Planctomycetaceae bacterium]
MLSIRPILLMLLCCSWSLPVVAQTTKDFELAPIDYHNQSTTNRISNLQRLINQDKSRLSWSDRHGYLPALLTALDIPVSSQVLVFSKTSVQVRYISPRRPRAIYFNDDTYVAWVQQGDMLEIIAMDPQLGGVFYTLPQSPSKQPQFRRDRGQCLLCHANRRTRDVPGPVVRSLYTAPSGQPHFGARTFVTDHTSPFSQRWGGYYVTGTHGSMRHMGNTVIPLDESTQNFDYQSGANLTRLDGLIDTDDYLSPHSDVVALMVLEHQSRMHNLITRAHFETDTVNHYDRLYNKALDRPKGFRSDISKRRIARVADDLLRYMLFVDEFTLKSPIQGTSKFSREFSRRGRRDKRGRSLRQLDLKRRLFRFPCSFLVESTTFAQLPDAVREQVVRRLKTILKDKTPDDDFARLSAEDRTAILEILEATRPPWWSPKTSPTGQANSKR